MKLNTFLILFLLFINSNPVFASFSEINDRKQRALDWYEYYVVSVKPYKTFISSELNEHKTGAFNWYGDTFESKKHFHSYLETDRKLHYDFALTWFEKHSK